MIKDIYSRSPESTKYNPNIVEVSEGLDQLILKIENVLFTRKGDVLGAPSIGCNLDDLIFSLVLNESYIENIISTQIQTYCLNSDQNYSIDTKVSFFATTESSAALVDIYVNDIRVIGALF